MLITISKLISPSFQLLCHVFMSQVVCIFVCQASAIISTLQKVLFCGQKHIISFFIVILSFVLFLSCNRGDQLAQQRQPEAVVMETHDRHGGAPRQQ